MNSFILIVCSSTSLIWDVVIWSSSSFSVGTQIEEQIDTQKLKFELLVVNLALTCCMT